MEYYSLILMSMVVFVLKPSEADKRLRYRLNYKNYIKTIEDHIRKHIGSNEMQNLKMKRDSNYNVDIEEAFKQDEFMQNFKSKYSITISLLNFKYTEILKKFLDYMHIIIDKCQQFRSRNLSENLICCVTSLVEEVKNSKIMFENLYNAMKFLSFIDVRFVFEGSIVTNVIIDEIDFFQKYVLQQITEISSFDLNSIPNLNDCETNFKNLNEFYTEALEKVNNLFQNNNIIDTSIKTDLTFQLKECSNGNDSYLVYLTCSKLNSFYNETIEIWYKNLGFEEFINPNTLELTPPIDSSINHYEGIKVLNILRQENGWKTMEHINIMYNGKQYTVDCVMKDPIDHMNFQIKKEHVTQLLRCRYTEIMKNYHVLLSAILFVCNTDAKIFKHKCLIELFNSFNKSKKMFEGLNTALITLKKSSIWSFNLNSHSNLHKIFKWITEFLNLLENNEFSRDNFVDQQGMNIKKIEILLKIFLHFRNNFYIEIITDMVKINRRCIMKESLYDKYTIVRNFRKSVYRTNKTNSLLLTQIYIDACSYFDNFCENVYKFCYEDLGFKKVDCLNNN
ncbi:uncharacterized protein LOC126893907 [Daktulosphaira vitifoliae]|uniref:uncharacterized protein LOC126893907 n=1 Tax=Daktulosphaira vitifoliae TaxID=58002 RepID=UPI0021AA5677|nr:uncharacterized protein LOC126893907 [Daktulosphaira vitifoliae]